VLIGDAPLVGALTFGDFNSAVNPNYVRQRHHNFRINFASCDGSGANLGKGERTSLLMGDVANSPIKGW